MKYLLSFFTFFIFVCLYVGMAVPDEIHIWADKKGAINITDREPDRPAKIIGKESNVLDSPEEIERYNQKRKSAQRQEEMSPRVTYRPQIIDRYNNNNDNEKAQKARREKDSRERQEYLEIEKARLNAVENKDYREARRQRLKAEKLYNESEIQKTRE